MELRWREARMDLAREAERAKTVAQSAFDALALVLALDAMPTTIAESVSLAPKSREQIVSAMRGLIVGHRLTVMGLIRVLAPELCCGACGGRGRFAAPPGCEIEVQCATCDGTGGAR